MSTPAPSDTAAPPAGFRVGDLVASIGAVLALVSTFLPYEKNDFGHLTVYHSDFLSPLFAVILAIAAAVVGIVFATRKTPLIPKMGLTAPALCAIASAAAVLFYAAGLITYSQAFLAVPGPTLGAVGIVLVAVGSFGLAFATPGAGLAKKLGGSGAPKSVQPNFGQFAPGPQAPGGYAYGGLPQGQPAFNQGYAPPQGFGQQAQPQGFGQQAQPFGQPATPGFGPPAQAPQPSPAPQFGQPAPHFAEAAQQFAPPPAAIRADPPAEIPNEPDQTPAPDPVPAAASPGWAAASSGYADSQPVAPAESTSPEAAYDAAPPTLLGRTDDTIAGLGVPAEPARPAQAATFTPYWAGVTSPIPAFSPAEATNQVGEVTPGQWYLVTGQHPAGLLLDLRGRPVLVRDVNALVRG